MRRCRRLPWFVEHPAAVIIALHLEGRHYHDMDVRLPPCCLPSGFGGDDHGFATTDYALWPMFAALWMLFLSSFATSAGSTGGGIKMMVRALLLYQAGLSSYCVHASGAVYHVRVGGGAGGIAADPVCGSAFGFIYMVSIWASR